MQKTFNCLILEDTLSDLLAIEMVMDQYPAINCRYVNDAKSFLKEINQSIFDLFIIDINLPESLTGIDLLEMIKQPKAWVIISSMLDSREYYEQFSKINFQKFYIRKPIEEYLFKTTIDSFLLAHQEVQYTAAIPHFQVKQGNFNYNISASEVHLIETNDHATTIYTATSKYTTYAPLREFEQKLTHSSFEKLNRSSLVNMDKVIRINAKESYAELPDCKVSISRSLKPIILEKFKNKAG